MINSSLIKYLMFSMTYFFFVASTKKGEEGLGSLGIGMGIGRRRSNKANKKLKNKDKKGK